MSGKGTEQLPHVGNDWYNVVKNHDYYEMTGKYPWFLLGWEDAPSHLRDNPDLWDPSKTGSELTLILTEYFDSSSYRIEYMRLRKEANDNFIWAKYMPELLFSTML
jgi:hypothetical protein